MQLIGAPDRFGIVSLLVQRKGYKFSSHIKRLSNENETTDLMMSIYIYRYVCIYIYIYIYIYIILHCLVQQVHNN